MNASPSAAWYALRDRHTSASAFWFSLLNSGMRDTTPPYTSYVGGSAAFEAPVPADLVEGAISAPGAGASGGLSWTYTGTLAPGASGSVRFAVKVNP